MLSLKFEVRNDILSTVSVVHKVKLYSAHTDLVFVLRNKVCKNSQNTNLMLLWNNYWLQASVVTVCFQLRCCVSEWLQSSLGDKPRCTAVGESVDGRSVETKYIFTGIQAVSSSVCSCQKSNQVSSIQLMGQMHLLSGIFFCSFGPTSPSRSQRFIIKWLYPDREPSSAALGSLFSCLTWKLNT